MKRLLIIGSANQDIVIRMDRIPEGGESRNVQEVQQFLGGKGANQAVAAARLGAQVSFAGKIGRDDAGRRLERALKESGVNTCLIDSERPTGCAYVLLEENAQNRILIDGGANNDFRREDLPRLQELIASHDMILLQLEINLPALEWILQTARERKKPVIVDASPAREGIEGMFRGVEILSPNETELRILTGRPCRTTEEQIKACRGLLKAGIRRVVLTLGEKGALLVEEKQVIFFSGRSVKALDPTGAGDAFTAGLAVGLLEGQSVEEAIEFATRAGALSVTRLGAQNSMPTRDAVEAFI